MKKTSVSKNILILLAALLMAGCAGNTGAKSAAGPDRAIESALDHLTRGKDLYVEEKNEQAIEEFSRAIALDKELIEAYLFRGAAYGNIGDFDRAIADFSEAIRLDPNDASAYHSRGVAYSVKAEWDRAIADFSEAVRIYPDNAVDYHNRGVAYSAKGEWDRAIADFEASLRIDPNQANTRQKLEEAMQEHGR